MRTYRIMVRIGLFTAILFALSSLSVAQVRQGTIKLDPKTLASYVGQYELNGSTTLIIRNEKDGLTFQATGQLRVPLEARSQTEFLVTTTDVSLTFFRNHEGKVTHLVVDLNGGSKAIKISDEVPPVSDTDRKVRVAAKVDPQIYNAYIGKYELAPGQVITVRRKGDELWTQLTGQPNLEIFPESTTNFFFRLVDAQLTFVKNKDAKVTNLILHQNGEHEALRVDDNVSKRLAEEDQVLHGQRQTVTKP